MKWMKKDVRYGDWYDLGDYLDRSNNYAENNQTYYINEVMSAIDATGYRCEAYDENGNVITNEVHVHISRKFIIQTICAYRYTFSAITYIFILISIQLI